MRVVALAGGTGSAKLLRGLASLTKDLTVVANVGDNYWFQGLYVCPDVDVAVYTLAGIANELTGWGIRGDSFNVLGQLSRLGEETWFRMGDLDLATAIVRTRMLRSGATLTEATIKIQRALGARARVLPATDSPVETMVSTRMGTLHLQEYWVKNRGRIRVTDVRYRGARKASPTQLVRRALENSDRVVVCPANPITSIAPITAINGMKRILAECRATVAALSPMVGKRPYSGPAGRLMRQLGVRPDSVGVASLYSGFVDKLVIDRSDRSLRERVEEEGVSCVVADTQMKSRSSETEMARVLLEA